MVKATKKHPRIHQLSIAQFEAMFPNEAACSAFLAKNRWPDGVVRCPRCSNEKVWELDSRAWHWQCKNCGADGYRFSVLVGTIFENTNKDLREWFRVIHLMLTSKKGISALQVMRYMGFGSYKTAWLMCHKVRTALRDKEFRKLVGIVEVDETYIGGREKNKHAKKKLRVGQGMGGKTAVLGMRERNGRTVAETIASTDTASLTREVEERVVPGSTIYTDTHGGYARMKAAGFDHKSVNHGAGEYVTKDGVGTNSIESVWAVLKRGVYGTYHQVSKKHLARYVDEFTFRLNDGNVRRHTLNRLDSLIKDTSGRRITYKQLTAE